MNVMITGASGGLGRALAAECAGRGYSLFLTDINEAGLMALQSGLVRQYGVDVAVKACDLTSEDSVNELFRFTDSCALRFDMLLNVAGIDHEGGFLRVESKEILDIVGLDVMATLRITHGLLKRRKPNRHFYLLFVSSLASLYPMPLKATYAASKRFLLDFSIALGQELKPQNVSVMALCPGGLPTTPDTIKAIEAQGIGGSLTTNKLEAVARNTLSNLLGGKRVYIPGALNRSLSVFGKILPNTAISAMIYSRWKYAQSKWLTNS